MSWFSSIPRRRRFRIFIRGISLIGGVLAAFVASILFEEKLYWWATLPTLIVLFAAIVEFVVGDILTERKFPARTEAILERYGEKLRDVHDELLSQLRLAIQSLRGCDANKVNGTVHLVVELFSALGDASEDAFVQITSYSGELGGRRWRFSHISKGIIGRCFRTRLAEWVNFATEEEYNERMVREFGYTGEEIKRHTKEARSYWAEPLQSKGEFVGVMFLFSTEPQVFPRAADRGRLEGAGANIVGVLRAAAII